LIYATATVTRSNAVPSFIQRYADKISGVLSGWDRIRFRGTLRRIANLRGMGSFLYERSVLLKDFKGWAMGLTETVRRSTERLAEEQELKVHHVSSSSLRKEELAKSLAGDRWERDGLSCILSCTELCRTFTVGPNRAQKRLELRQHDSKCLHYYFYLRHPEWGPLHVRLQTWLPYSVHVCLNGRDWLGTQLTRLGLPHTQCDNTFTFVADMGRAQRLLDRQLKTNWDLGLQRLLDEVHPSGRALFGCPMHYYWSGEETEWATDVMFRSADDLARLYPRLVGHGIRHFGGDDVLRFLGRPGSVRRQTAARLQSDLKTRHEGVRLKHSLNRNSLKMYDKQASVLRVETTVNDPRDMKVYRSLEGDPAGPKAWRRLRKGVADLHRRAEVSQAANERYLAALATVEDTATLEEATAAVCRSAQWAGGRVRALNPLADEDAALLAAVNRGEFAINGFRNRDLLPLLEGPRSDEPAAAKRQAAKVTRRLRLLRAHKLIAKVPKTHRYVLTDSGRTVINAILAARQADTQKLTQLAA
jgi:hypothetical protein